MYANTLQNNNIREFDRYRYKQERVFASLSIEFLQCVNFLYNALNVRELTDICTSRKGFSLFSLLNFINVLISCMITSVSDATPSSRARYARRKKRTCAMTMTVRTITGTASPGAISVRAASATGNSKVNTNYSNVP